MNNQDIIIEKTKALLSMWCYEGLKAAAEEWLKAVGTADEKKAGEKYVAVLEDSIVDIDSVIEFFTGDIAIEKFGPEKASELAALAKENKAKGETKCDCPACTAAKEILKYKEDLLA